MYALRALLSALAPGEECAGNLTYAAQRCWHKPGQAHVCRPYQNKYRKNCYIPVTDIADRHWIANGQQCIGQSPLHA